MTSQKTFYATYKPLILVTVFLVGLVMLVEVKHASFDTARAMTHFMAGFFLFFSFFKFLNLTGFAKAFATYDVLAKRSKFYAHLYPFLELALGILFLLNAFPLFTNLFALTLMLVGTVGVVQALREKRTIQCACLGTIFDLPMTKVTVFENGLMALMSAGMAIHILWAEYALKF